MSWKFLLTCSVSLYIKKLFWQAYVAKQRDHTQISH